MQADKQTQPPTHTHTHTRRLCRDPTTCLGDLVVQQWPALRALGLRYYAAAGAWQLAWLSALGWLGAAADGETQQSRSASERPAAA